MKKLDEEYGPLEWRLPEASAIYWAAQGLERIQQNPTRTTEDLIVLRRVIYQCMQLTWQRGRIVENPFSDEMEFGPNLAMIPKVNDTYLKMYEEEADQNQRDGILRAHRNFLRQSIYTLYVYNRIPDAAKWFKVLAEKYPDKTIIDGDFNSYPRNVTLDRYVVACVQEDINDTSKDRAQAIIEGLIMTSYMSLVIDEDDRAAGLMQLARGAWQNYMTKIPQERYSAIGLAPFQDMQQTILRRLLDLANDVPPEAKAILRTKLNLPKEETPPTVPAEQPAATQGKTP